MKNRFINYCMNMISEENKFDEIKLEEIRYGLITFYLFITKYILLVIVASLLGLLKEMFIFTFFFSFIRMYAGGLHANKTWICTLTSLSLFLGLPYISSILSINVYIKAFILIIGIIIIYKYSPADTKKKPIVSKRIRLIRKWKSTITTILYSFLSLFINDIFISNSLMFIIVVECILILPLTYKFFHFEYNNYLLYIKE